MIEKDCETCKEVMKVFGDYSPCVACDDSCSNWQPSELYTAYLQMQAHAELAEFWKQQDINQELDFGDEGVPCMCAS